MYTAQPASPSSNALNMSSIAAMGNATPLQHSLDSTELLQGQKTVSIVHNGATYRLQATKLGKLILTK